MNLFEYQGKDLYKKYSITTPKSIFIKSISDLTENHGLSYPLVVNCLLYTSPSPRDQRGSRMPSSA